MVKKYYAVKNGRNTGIYNTWGECKSQVNGYSGAVHKSFSTKREAEAYMNNSSTNSYQPRSYASNRNNYYSHRNSYNDYTPSYSYSGSSSSSSSRNYHKNSNTESNKAVAYVDGSYNASTREYGSGAVIFHDSNKYNYKEKFDHSTHSKMRNVAGELEAAKTAIKYCVDNNVPELDLHYDYTGIKNWATGDWKTNKPGTIQYKQYYDDVKDKVKVNFEYVKAHSNNKYNDEADRLAKSAVFD